MSLDYYVPTGTILKEYLEANNITQKALAEKVGCSEKHISNLINGEAKLTEEIAIALEDIFQGTPASFWLNIETNYRLALARAQKDEKKEHIEDIREISNKFRFRDVFKGLGWPIQKQYDEMLKLLNINNFSEANKKLSALNVDFMQDGGSKEAILIWLALCEEQIDLQNNDIKGKDFDVNELKSNITKFKRIVYTDNFNQTIKNIRIMCNILGIYFVCNDAIPGSKVRGAITSYKGSPTIYLSTRLKYIDVIWFALFHELGHLIYDYKSGKTIISLEEELSNAKEERANIFARNNLIDIEAYNNFCEKNEFNESSILEFAKEQKVIPGLVVGFLHHDKIFEGKDSYKKFSYMRAKI